MDDECQGHPVGADRWCPGCQAAVTRDMHASWLADDTDDTDDAVLTDPVPVPHPVPDPVLPDLPVMVSPAEQRAQRLEVIRPLLDQASELRTRFEQQAATGPADEQPYWLASARLQIDHSNDLKAMARGTSLLRTLPTTTAIEPPVVDPLLDTLTDVELAALGGPWSQTAAAATAHVRTALEARATALTAATGKAATSGHFTELLDAAYQRAGHAPGAWAREPICAQDAENSLADQVDLVGEQGRYDAAIATLELVTGHARAIRAVTTAHEAATRGPRWSLRRPPAPEPLVYPSFRSAWPTLTAVLDGHAWAYHEYVEAAGTT